MVAGQLAGTTEGMAADRGRGCHRRGGRQRRTGRVPDLRGAVAPGGDMLGDSGTGETDLDTSEDGHGTAVAVLLAGQGYGTGTVGIAPQAKILPVAVSSPGASGQDTSETVAAGIMFAVRHGAAVINLSLGLDVLSAASCDPGLQDAVAYALTHNVVVIAGAGDVNITGPGPVQPGILRGGPGGGWCGAGWVALARQSATAVRVSVAADGGPHGLRRTGRPVYDYRLRDQFLFSACFWRGGADPVAVSEDAVVSGGSAARRHGDTGRHFGPQRRLRVRDHRSGPCGERLGVPGDRVGAGSGVREVQGVAGDAGRISFAQANGLPSGSAATAPAASAGAGTGTAASPDRLVRVQV